LRSGMTAIQATKFDPGTIAGATDTRAGA